MDGLTRRDVLLGASAMAIAGAMPTFDLQPKPTGWAILGLGNYAQNNILPNIIKTSHCKPAALISGSPDKAKSLATKYGISEKNLYNYQNMDAIRDNPEIDVVYVITPPGTHHEFTMRALKAGKHVCCEKPMASYAKDCAEMVAEAKKRNLRLQVGYRCHFEPYNLEAVRICRSGELGNIRTIKSDHGFTLGWGGSWHAKRPLGGFGAISEIGIYSIQALCYLAGADPVEVIGTRDKLKVDWFKEVEDVNHFLFKFPNGIQGIGATAYSWNANNFSVMGDKGRLVAEPATPYEGHNFHVNGRQVTVEPANQWARQMDHMAECIRDSGKTLITPGEMGWRDIRLIEAILESADTGKAVKFKP